MKDRLNVTEAYLPNIEKYKAYIDQIWQSKWLTNNGKIVQELERKIKSYTGVERFLYCNNGTIVLQMAMKSLGITKEVITTPFSYVATTNAILWEGAKPVFADIQSSDFNIDPSKIEAYITKDTQAIMATHVFGNPCAIEEIQYIATKHNLAVIYDAAHAFGTLYQGKSLLSYGDIATCSFHATKIFHTAEGGGLFCQSDELFEKLFLSRQFGHVGDNYFSVGVNGKASEFHAAMGLCVMEDFEEICAARKNLTAMYDAHLDMDNLQRPISLSNTEYNYAYYPVVFASEKILLQVKKGLEENNIFPRRYFFPSLNTLPFVGNYQSCPISEDIASRILCLPFAHNITVNQVEEISAIVNKMMK